MANLYTVIVSGYRNFQTETRDIASALQTARRELHTATAQRTAGEVIIYLNGKVVHLENNYKTLVKNIDMGDYSEDFDYTEGG